jgi:predicted ATPase
MEAIELRIESQLRLGQSSELVAELEALVAEHPHHERMWRQLMLALYRADRQADALAAYHRARRALDRELGVEPGPELVELEAAILRQEVPFEAAAPPGNGLPTPVTSFVGRQRELIDADRLLDRARIVTLTGVGGVGKTRLGLEVARAALPSYADGAWFVDLARLSAPELLAGEVARALGVAEEAGIQPEDRLVGHLREREALVVLDNCEHLIGACAELVRVVLAGSPDVRILATSRVPLGVGGELVYPVPPLSLASEGGAAPGRSDAAALFLERASGASPTIDLDAVDLEIVERICADLEGLPLALELAAARTRSLALPEIAGRLRDRFRFLVSWRRLATARHQTLREAMDWSYELLAPDARRALDRLSVCAGGCDLEAATAICELGDDMAALDAIERLLDASLVTAVRTTSGASRYQLLETVREYGTERLAESGDLAAARRQHAEHYGALALAAAKPIRIEPDGPAWMERLATERDNIRAALNWLRDAGEHTQLLRIAEALWWYWWVRAEAAEGRAWLRIALDGEDASEEHQLRASALLGLAGLAWSEGDYDAAAAAATEAEGLFGKIHDDASRGRAWNTIGVIEHGRGDVAAAVAAFDRSIELYRTPGGAIDAARARSLATSIDNRASALLERGDLAAAILGYEEAKALYTAYLPGKETALYDLHLGRAALRQGRHADAAALLGQALEEYRSQGFLQYTTECLEGLAWVANAGGRHGDAAVLLGAASGYRERTRTPKWGRMSEEFDQQVAIARAALGETAFETGWAAGRSEPEAAIDVGIEVAEAARVG